MRYLKIVEAQEGIQNMLMFPSTSHATSSFISHCPQSSSWSPPFCLASAICSPSSVHPTFSFSPLVQHFVLVCVCVPVHVESRRLVASCRVMLCLSWRTHVRRRRRETSLDGKQAVFICRRQTCHVNRGRDRRSTPSCFHSQSCHRRRICDSARCTTPQHGRACTAVSREIECFALQCSQSLTI